MKQIKEFFFPKWSAWQDIHCYDVNGYYTLIQMRHRIRDNKKRFRKARMGFINDSYIKTEIYKRATDIIKPE